MKAGGPHGLVEFRYQLVEVWERLAEAILAGGLGTLPLAPISDVRGNEVAAVVQRVRQRFENEAKPAEAIELTTAMAILMGLRYESEQIDQLLKGVRGMEESSTYRVILEKGIEKGIQRGKEQGRVEEARSTLLRVGAKFLGAPSSPVASRIDGLSDWKRLETLIDRVLEGGVSSWDELLGPA